MIRNFLFSIFFFMGIFTISIIFIPALFLPQKIVLFGGKIMGYWASFCLRFFLSTKLIIKGKENIIKDKKFFIAASHQSMFETFFLQTIFNSPVFVLKKELLMIPIFGWYLKKIGSISIKRNKISKDNLGFFEDILKLAESSNRPLIIFPQGTRLMPGDRTPFKKGASRIYEELKISCQPVAINSGNTWPKNGFKKINTTLTISILKPINPGQDKEIFLENLQNTIYSELNFLDKKSNY
jgi:1-acyl-sn-glycerol-3-phosphate acyltransferase